MQSISVIIPVYNEAKIIKENLNTIKNFLDSNNFNYEIIIIEDGSIDDTHSIIKNFQNEKIKILKNNANKGKGYSIKRGALESSNELIFFTDADLSAPINEIINLLNHINDYHIVIGSRAVDESVEMNKPKYQRMLGRAGNLAIQALAVKGIKDTQCGFKLFKKECLPIFQKQTIDRWGFDFEILFLAQLMNFKIKEVPVTWYHSRDSKLKLTDYYKTLNELFKIKKNYKKGIYNL